VFAVLVILVEQIINAKNLKNKTSLQIKMIHIIIKTEEKQKRSKKNQLLTLLNVIE